MRPINAISKPVVLDLELWQIRLLEKLAAENGRTIEELVNQIVREWIECRRTPAVDAAAGDSMSRSAQTRAYDKEELR